MTIREDILAELTTDPITMMFGETWLGGLNVLEAELAEQAAKIKTKEDVIEQGCKYGFLILILGKEQYKRVTGNKDYNGRLKRSGGLQCHRPS